MPFNGSGSFSIVNTFVPNTTILSAAVNQNFTDIATGLSDCLTRDGQAGMTAVFKAVSGSLSAPGVSFNSDATAGMFLSASGIVGLVARSLGLIVNSDIFKAISATVQAGGSGYAVGDVIVTTGGTAISQPAFIVATLSGSAVATVTVGHQGALTATPSNPVAQGSTSGSGTGCTLNVTYNDRAGAVYRSIVTNELGALPWIRLGSSTFVSGLMAKATAYDYLTQLVTIGSGFSVNKTTSPPTITTTLNPTLVPNYLSGLTLSAAGSTGTFGIAAGVANDSTNVTLMSLGSAYTKTTSSWAVGTGNGGLDTGAIATSTWYHVYEIYRPDTAVVDIVFSTSASAPTLPTNYTLYRRIGSMKTDGSSQWLKFTQTGDTFIWSASVADVNNIVSVASRVNKTLSTPTGIVTAALFRTAATGATNFIFTSLQESDQTPTTLFCDLVTGASASLERFTDTSSQIGVRANNTSANYSVFTYGWKDTRGKQ